MPQHSPARPPRGRARDQRGGGRQSRCAISAPAIAVEDKADESPVTIADRETEEHIRRAILERFPAHGILGEEFGSSGSDSRLHLDRRSDRRHALLHLRHAALRHAARRGARRRGGGGRHPHAGARRGFRRLPRRRRDLERRADPLPPLADRSRTRASSSTRPKRIMAHEPRASVAADGGRALHALLQRLLAFALLAAGQIDVVVDFDLKPYDYLPVVPVVEAAGGVMTDWSGRAARARFGRHGRRGGERRSCTGRSSNLLALSQPAVACAAGFRRLRPARRLAPTAAISLSRSSSPYSSIWAKASRIACDQPAEILRKYGIASPRSGAARRPPARPCDRSGGRSACRPRGSSAASN